MKTLLTSWRPRHFFTQAWRSAAPLLLGCVTASSAMAMPTYSIDFQGPSWAPGGGPGGVSDGDILTPVGSGKLPLPGVVIPAASGPGTLGLDKGFTGRHEGYELDALSYGLEQPLFPGQLRNAFSWSFSVDEFAIGHPGASIVGPSVFTEGAMGAMEASADIYNAVTPGGAPAPLPIGPNVGLFDGNGGMTPFAAPGLNLVEPNPPTPGPLFGQQALRDEGDNLDAWNFRDRGQNEGDIRPPVFFSMDSQFPDPLETFPANTGSAAAQGFNGGDVLMSDLSGAGPTLYADSRFLGLNEGSPIGEPNELDIDDLDALVLHENGDGIYSPTFQPFDWIDGQSDMLLFSLRRGSDLLNRGVLDALGSGLRITEGDILIPVYDPVDGVAVQDGVEGDWDVGIFVNAEALGLSTVRSGAGAVWGEGEAFNPRFQEDIWDDDLDALDVVQLFLLPGDYNQDGVVDAADYTIWRAEEGMAVLPFSGGDGNGDGLVDEADFKLWRSNYGASSPGASIASVSAAVPEPSSLLIGLLAMPLAFARRQRDE